MKNEPQREGSLFCPVGWVGVDCRQYQLRFIDEALMFEEQSAGGAGKAPLTMVPSIALPFTYSSGLPRCHGSRNPRRPRGANAVLGSPALVTLLIDQFRLTGRKGDASLRS